MNCVVLTPEAEVFNNKVKSVKVPGVGGQFEILNNHAPIVSALGEGEIRIFEESGNLFTFTIVKGFIEVINNEVSLMVIEPQAK